MGKHPSNICLPSMAKKRRVLPIETTFNLPSPIPNWPAGEGFGIGSIDLGGLEVRQISSLYKVWATDAGGPANLGASFFEPSAIPEGFFMLGCYCQPNNKPLSGWVLVGKDNSNDPSGGTLKRPIDYTLVWSSESLNIRHESNGYVWLPTPSDGYKALGHVVTNTPDKPSLDRIRCVRTDLTEQCEVDAWIWGSRKGNTNSVFNVYSTRPSNRGVEALGIGVGTFVAINNGGDAPASLSLACLRNTQNISACMPNLSQIEALVEAYSPWIYFHPDETYLPSSVYWFFVNGALLYNKEQESEPVLVDATGSNLPQGGSNDGRYWLDLPVDEAAKGRVIKGNLETSKAYLHVKPELGGTFTDIVIWTFYPFNGPAKAKIKFINVPLGKIGEHVGDWEHVTLRVSNFNGELWRVYFSQHSKGTWMDASELEFHNGNKVVAYSSLHGHAFYPKPGLVLQGSNGIGIRNDTAKSKMVMDVGQYFSIVAAEYLGMVIQEPPWLNYFGQWGPKISYDIANEIKKVAKALPGKLRAVFEKIIRGLPREVLGEEGPTGPKVKQSWMGDEV